MKKTKAFTLIELLVVLAIIGILAAIIIGNVQSARTKAQGKAVISSMSSLREGGELYYNANFTYTGFCASTCAGGSSDWKKACASIDLNNGAGVVGCTSTASTWCADSALVGGGYYCVDSNKNAVATTCNSATNLCY